MKKFHLYLYGPQCGPIEASFESTYLRLEQLEKLYAEPDGSFMSARDQGRQQIFGMLYDAHDKLQYVELRGQCTVETWRELLAALVSEINHELAVMTLPERQLQTLQSFEKTFKPTE